MPRKRKPPSGEDQKISVVLPPALVRKIDQGLERRSLRSRADLIREILEDNIDRYTGDESLQRIHLELTRVLARGLGVASDLSGMTPQSVIQLILSDHLLEYLEKGRNLVSALETKLNEKAE